VNRKALFKWFGYGIALGLLSVLLLTTTGCASKRVTRETVPGTIKAERLDRPPNSLRFRIYKPPEQP